MDGAVPHRWPRFQGAGQFSRSGAPAFDKKHLPWPELGGGSGHDQCCGSQSQARLKLAMGLIVCGGQNGYGRLATIHGANQRVESAEQYAAHKLEAAGLGPPNLGPPKSWAAKILGRQNLGPPKSWAIKMWNDEHRE